MPAEPLTPAARRQPDRTVRGHLAATRRPRGRRGRPQDPALDDAILTATVDLLREVGYGGLTMDAVALVAGVSKATIYRRWPSKADLLISVIDTASDVTLAPPDTGSLRDDLVALLASLGDILRGPGGHASRALLGAVTHDPDLADAFRRGPLARWAAAFGQAFERAADRGEVSDAAGASLAAEAGPGIFLQRWLIPGATIDASLAAEVVDEIMMPSLHRNRWQ